MIVCENITKIYDDAGVKFKALDHVSLEIKKGEFVAIVGQSGCGKSTLLNILGLLDTLTHGQYHLDGVNMGKASDYKRTLLRRDKIGFVFQSFNLLPRLSVLENVALPMRYGGKSSKDVQKRSIELLEQVGLKSKIKNNPLQLSGGQKQRVALARALVNDPKVILADEPTGNLDSKSSEEVMQLLTELNEKGLTVLMVTHSNELAARAHRIISIKDGQIV